MIYHSPGSDESRLVGACWLRGPGVPPLPGLRASSLPPGPGYESDEEGGLCNIRRKKKTKFNKPSSTVLTVMTLQSYTHDRSLIMDMAFGSMCTVKEGIREFRITRFEFIHVGVWSMIELIEVRSCSIDTWKIQCQLRISDDATV